MHTITLLSSICLLSGSVLSSPFPLPQGGNGGSVYPQKAAGDAPYSNPEARLKSAIKFPTGFSPTSKKMPVILAPGTGVTGTQTYVGNFQKLMNNSAMYDPIPLDIPDSLLDDVQSNAEFHAYAINMIGAMTGKQVSIVTWSQGGMDMQWAMKYWPSARPVVSDFVAISPDFNGTTLQGAGPYLETVQGVFPLAPALLQQEADSVFTKTLRANGGDSAYVPTTTIYSNADEVVSPQEGTGASSFLKSANGVPANNYQVQTVCGKDAPAGGPFTHEGVLYNSFAIAIAMDAFANPGPGDVKRIDVKQVCSLPLAQGLDANDKALTDDTIEEAAGNILYNTGVLNIVQTEPEIKPYAQKDRPVGYAAPSLSSSLGLKARENAIRGNVLARYGPALKRREMKLKARSQS